MSLGLNELMHYITVMLCQQKWPEIFQFAALDHSKCACLCISTDTLCTTMHPLPAYFNMGTSYLAVCCLIIDCYLLFIWLNSPLYSTYLMSGIAFNQLVHACQAALYLVYPSIPTAFMWIKMWSWCDLGWLCSENVWVPISLKKNSITIEMWLKTHFALIQILMNQISSMTLQLWCLGMCNKLRWYHNQ